MKRKKILSITKKDFKVDTFRGSGKGGQKKQKTSSGVRITHIESGSIGKSTDTRFQSKNKQLAFRRLVDSDKFQKWLKIKCSKTDAIIQQVEREVCEDSSYIKVESRNDDGRWTEGLTNDND